MLKSVTTTYKVTKAEIKSLLAKELGVDESRITVTFTIGYEGGDDRFGFSSSPVCNGLTVEVKN